MVIVMRLPMDDSVGSSRVTRWGLLCGLTSALVFLLSLLDAEDISSVSDAREGSEGCRR